MFKAIEFFIALLLLLISAVSVMAGNNSGSAFSTWPDTGQTKCYNNTAETPCPAFGEPFYGQEPQYARPDRSYTTLGGGEMVQDNVTGLAWEMKNNKDGIDDYSNPNDADNGYSWCDTNPETNGGDEGACNDHDTQDFINQLNSSNFGGHNDWRIPTIKELVTLADLGRSLPAIDPVFAATTQSMRYWSSTTVVESKPYAWGVVFKYGNVDVPLDGKLAGGYVRAVRGGQVQSEDRYVDNQDGTVTDTVTCLQWQKATMDTKNGVGPDTYNWQDALAVSENFSLAGHSDWRLPDENELRSLVDYSRGEPAIGPVFTATTLPSLYWSSTSSDNYAWLVNFGHGPYYSGYSYRINNKSLGSYVRAVRGVQCGGLGTRFEWPVRNRNEMTNGYAKFNYKVKDQYHTGFDLTSTTGSLDILAVAPGNVIIFDCGECPDKVDNHGMGKVIIVDHNQGKGPFSLYAHLDAISVAQNDKVDAGQIIGIMGDTGCENEIEPCGVHLHFEMKQWAVLGSVSNDSGPQCQDIDSTAAVPDIPLRPVIRGYEGIGFRKLFGAIA